VHDRDIDLVRRTAAGDNRAAAALIARHLSRITGLAARMLSDASEAEDVAQETFLRAWKAAGQWREGEALFSTWLYRVATNLCLDRLRRRRETPHPDAGAEMIDPALGADHGLALAERGQAVRAALDTLPERQRAAIVLCHFEELGNIEAAAILEVSVEALESLLARGRRTLRARLAGLETSA
jgi:RNA polymerase sigma-70 factor, ECF subfamily